MLFRSLLPNRHAVRRGTRSNADSLYRGRALVRIVTGRSRDERGRAGHIPARWSWSRTFASLDTVRSCLKCWPRCGRLAQRESVPFTRERSQVQSLQRPPSFPFNWAMQPIPEIHHLRFSASSRSGNLAKPITNTPRRDPQASSANHPLLREKP